MKQINNLVKKIKGSGRTDIIEHSKLMEMVGQVVDNYDGSWRELALIADRLESIGKTIANEAKPNAHVEALLDGEDGKHEFMGNHISLRTYKTYEYDESDPYISKLQTDLDDVAEYIKPLKDKEKAIKKSIKSAKDQQVVEGKAELIEEKKSIAISRT